MILMSGGQARDIILKFSDEHAKRDWIAAIKQHIAYCNNLQK